ncbi:MAG: hypothetical protein ACJAUD_000978 [Crocinitomicaceae bacterium]|jgi:hypothetical protein
MKRIQVIPLLILLTFSNVLLGQDKEVELSRFEKKCFMLAYKGKEIECNAFMDKRIKKGKLSARDLSYAYDMKCVIYLRYNFWNTIAYKKDTKNSKYPFSKTKPISYSDTLIKYSKLLLENTDTSSLNYKEWLGYNYNEICKTLFEDMNGILLKAEKNKNYYTSNKNECDSYFDHLSFLKKVVKDYHPINQFAFDLKTFNYKHQLGLSNEEDEAKIYDQISNYLFNQFDLRHYEGTALYDRLRNDHRILFGYDAISSQLKFLIKELIDSKSDLGKRIMDICSIDIIEDFDHILFKFHENYDNMWTVNDGNQLRKIGLIDLRDSSIYKQPFHPIYVDIKIDFDVAKWDTIVIDEIAGDDEFGIELVKKVRLTGKGSTVLKVKLYGLLPEMNSTRPYSNGISIISNRGKKRIKIEADIIGQSPGLKTNPISDDHNDILVQKNYPYYFERVLGITCKEMYGTDKLKIYRYPLNDEPICEINVKDGYSSTKRIHPLEKTKDSVYHFNLLEETAEAYKVVYSTYYWDYEIGWIKKKDFDTTTYPVDSIVQMKTLTEFYKSCSYIVLRDPSEEVFFSHELGEKFKPRCKVFKYVSHSYKDGNIPIMVVAPCEKCINSPLEKWGKGNIRWNRNQYLLVEGVSE